MSSKKNINTLFKSKTFLLFTGAMLCLNTPAMSAGVNAKYECTENCTTTEDVILIDTIYEAAFAIAGDEFTSFTNNHLINVDYKKPEGDSIGVGICGYYGENATITNTGTILAKGTLLGVGFYNMEFINSSFINSGLIKSDISIYSEESLTITNKESGILEGIMSAYNSVVTNNGTINLDHDIHDISSISKTYTQGTSGVLGIKATLNEDGSSTHSKLTVEKGVSLADGTTIDVDVTATNTAAKTFVESNSVLTGVVKSLNHGEVSTPIEVNVDKLNITDNSALLDFEALLSDSGKSLDLRSIEGSSLVDAVMKSDRKKEVAVAKILEDSSNSDIGVFKSYLNTLPTNNAVAKAVGQVTPVSTASTQSVSNQITNTMSKVVQARQSSLRGFSSGDISFSDKNVWIKPFGGYTSQDNVDGINGFSANTFGLGFGIDAEYKSGNRAGLALFYTNADVDTNDVDQSSDIDVFNLVAYGSNPLFDDKTSLFYQVGLGLQKTDASRVISGVGTAKADFTSKNLFLQLKASRNIEINKSFKAKPAIVTSYAYYKNPSYSESGVGGLNLNVEEFSSKSFVLGFESDFTYAIDKNSKILTNIALSYDFNNEAQSINSTFQGGGTVFSTEGIKNDALIYKLGLGFITRLQQNLFIDFKYDFDGRGSDFQNHVVSSKINYKF